jgi:uncharacterized membrane protein
MKDLILNPRKFMVLNVVLTVFWIVMVPVSILTGWVSTVEYVAALSIYALVAAHLSTYAAARTEVMQDEASAEIRETVQRLRKIDPDHPVEKVDVDIVIEDECKS